MIIRDGVNVKYSHDEEALIAELLKLREFAGVMEEELVGWLEDLRIWNYSNSYWVHPRENRGFIDSNRWESWVPEAVKVRLWNFEAVGSKLVQTHGFSCVVCGVRSAWAKRGRIPWDIERCVWDRQTISAPALICRECAIDVQALMSPWIKEKWREAALQRLFDRLVPFNPGTGPPRR